jgi:hypothetical protein
VLAVIFFISVWLSKNQFSIFKFSFWDGSRIKVKKIAITYVDQNLSDIKSSMEFDLEKSIFLAHPIFFELPMSTYI